ncbi:hypothetical protein DRE_03242 [Drechslerella stenobrocha 248]|uniref:ZZ-type domain-containing protein n=1 Tax=Drechslerella stenobrocha 248 TaxID=1043628 RepID=W7I5A2_9PEZI|nr:hypothetical protein DRE_03242 [Drechslerella stenobrocha 248]
MQNPVFNRQDILGLHLVRTPVSEIAYTCDIIILHGLNGGPAKTWRHPDGHIWFADFLPSDIADPDSWTNARIWTYGYDADTAFTSTSSSALDFARNLLYRVNRIREGFEHHKIIWVCHSLGGIVTKTALVEAQLIPDYQPILAQTIGIIFLGTPHNGSSMATVAEIGAKIAGVVLPDAIMPKNRSLIKSLRKDSARLFETAGRFANICGAMKIYSMYESMPTAGGVKVVERESAVMNLGKIETQVMLDGTNHRTMCRYQGPTDQNYLAVLDAIRKLTKSTSTLFDPPEIPPARPSAQLKLDASASTSSFFSQSSGFNTPSSDGARSQASSFSASSGYASTASQNGRPPSSISTQTSSTYSTIAPPRPPAKEPISMQWPHYFGQDERRYGSSPYDSPGTSSYSPNPHPNTSSPPPTFNTAQQDFSSRSVMSANSTSSLYNAPYNSQPNNNGQPNNTTSSSYKPPNPNQSYESSHTPSYRPHLNSTPSQQFKSSHEAANNASPTYNSNYESTTSTRPSKPTAESAETWSRAAPSLAESKPSLPPPPTPHWICDGCRSPIYPFESRIHCLDCPDYDICGDCHEKDIVKDAHRRHHKVELIVKARQITQEHSELIIPSDVHPERSPGRQFVNWTVRNERRIHHLSCHDDHARYLVSSLEPGNYRVSFQVELFLAESFLPEHTKQLAGEALGKLRMAVGFINSKKAFFKDRFAENQNLVGRLFDSGWYDDYDIKPLTTTSIVHLNCILSVDGNMDRDDVGIMFQWSDFKKFQSSDKALISMSLASVRFEDLMEYDSSGDAKQIVKYVEPPTQVPAADSAASMLTLDDIFQAIVEVAKEEERDRQEQEAFQLAIAEELARRRRAQVEAQEREAAAELMANYMVASQATVEFALLAEYLKYLTNQ